MGCVSASPSGGEGGVLAPRGSKCVNARIDRLAIGRLGRFEPSEQH